jgi:peptide/nickel transport system permease protein
MGLPARRIRYQQPVLQDMLNVFPATLELAVTASVLAFAIGVPMGVYTGIHRDSLLSRVFMIGSLVGVSLPTFLLGILLILCFSVGLGWLPSFGRGPVVHVGSWWTTGFTSWAGIRALILPGITLGLFQMTLMMLEVLRTDYIKFARARGLTDRTIHFGHALKNTLVPVITIIGLQFGGIVGFSLVTETVFQWPGMGLLLVQSVAVADIPVMSAYLLLIALVFLAINLIVDLLYYAVDPRLRIGR